MEIVTTLDSKDIAQIIAKHFGVEESKVRVYTVEGTRGYGEGEYTTHTPFAKVIMNKE